MAEIKVLTPGMFRGVFPTLVPEFERAHGHKVALTTVTPGMVKEKLLGGESPDVAFAVDHQMQELEQAGKVLAQRLHRDRPGVCRGRHSRRRALNWISAPPDAVKRAIRAAQGGCDQRSKGWLQHRALYDGTCRPVRVR